MRGFRQRTTLPEVDALLVAAVPPSSCAFEEVASVDAHGRVAAEDAVALHDVPGFDRSAMDGYALRGEDTFGAVPYGPVAFRIIGSSLAGHGFDGVVGPGDAVRIMTGAPLPAGADAVLRAEDTVEKSDDQMEAIAAVSPRKHVSTRGEDIRTGVVVVPAGRRLRPQDIGVLVSTGIGCLSVFRRPRVDVVITGDELLPPGSAPEGSRIVDSNSSILRGLVERDGGEVIDHDLVPDDRNHLTEVLRACQGDVILISGGTSVGVEDHAPRIVEELGRLAVHGVAMRPSSPTGIGFLPGRRSPAPDGERPVFLLPGNPVSCLCAYDFFAGPTIRSLGGRSRDLPYRSQRRRLAAKITSITGRVDYARVREASPGDGCVEPLAVSGASILTSTTRADGFVIVPHDDEGIPAGEEVTVYYYGE